MIDSCANVATCSWCEPWPSLRAVSWALSGPSCWRCCASPTVILRGSISLSESEMDPRRITVGLAQQRQHEGPLSAHETARNDGHGSHQLQVATLAQESIIVVGIQIFQIGNVTIVGNG